MNCMGWRGSQLGLASLCTTWRHVHNQRWATAAYSTELEAGGPENLVSLAVVGAGPAGFYFTDRILKLLGNTVKVDIIDKLPTPFGLVRNGVAPDHPDTKKVVNKFTTIAGDKRVRFFGNVTIGTDSHTGEISIEELKSIYSGVILSYGASQGRQLGIPGENLQGVFTATQFVNWYNGHPDFQELPVDLRSTRSVGVVGVGNVALDCARILLKPVEALQGTDISDSSLHQLHQSRVTDVHVLGRRGPFQNQFSGKELREILGLPNVSVHLHPDSYTPTDLDLLEPRKNQKAVAAMNAANGRQPNSKPKRALHLHFLASPTSVSHSPGTDTIASITVQKNRLERSGDRQRADGTGVTEQFPMDLLITSVGYEAVLMAGVPFNKSRGVVPNLLGRVVQDVGSTQVVTGLYVAGWLKRGAQGIIGTNLVDAHETAYAVAEDFASSAVTRTSDGGESVPRVDEFSELLSARGIHAVSWQDWLKIDAAEVKNGAASHRPRVKFTSYNSIREVLASDFHDVSHAEKKA